MRYYKIYDVTAPSLIMYECQIVIVVYHGLLKKWRSALDFVPIKNANFKLLGSTVTTVHSNLFNKIK